MATPRGHAEGTRQAAGRGQRDTKHQPDRPHHRTAIPPRFERAFNKGLLWSPSPVFLSYSVPAFLRSGGPFRYVGQRFALGHATALFSMRDGERRTHLHHDVHGSPAGHSRSCTREGGGGKAVVQSRAGNSAWRKSHRSWTLRPAILWACWSRRMTRVGSGRIDPAAARHRCSRAHHTRPALVRCRGLVCAGSPVAAQRWPHAA
jgi:hypothetical protein